MGLCAGSRAWSEPCPSRAHPAEKRQAVGARLTPTTLGMTLAARWKTPRACRRDGSGSLARHRQRPTSAPREVSVESSSEQRPPRLSSALRSPGFRAERPQNGLISSIPVVVARVRGLSPSAAGAAGKGGVNGQWSEGGMRSSECGRRQILLNPPLRKGEAGQP